MTKENIETLAHKLYEESGSGYSICYLGAENALTVFEGITEENAWESSMSILNGIPRGDTWSAIFKTGALQAAGVVPFSDLMSVLRASLLGA